ncbi:MAG: esterase FrsA [Acidimicrobiia bacterium]|nr:esterase FrsA [Acidimicrobiia bacterium]MDH5505453.1 esterase FrsA [Acidimicrobiia bacterium]
MSTLRQILGHPDPVIAEVLETWTPRFLRGGTSVGDLVSTVDRMETWDDWVVEWTITAGVHETLAKHAESDGRRLAATAAWMDAFRCHHLAYFVSTRDLELHNRGLANMLRCHDNALPYLEPAVEKVEIPGVEGASRMVGLLSLPKGVDVAPVVIVLPGLDSTKETRHQSRGGWLRRGIAVLSVDGPGQGESSQWSTIRPDYEVAISGVIDWIETRADLDASRVGVFGTSLAGYYAPRAAAFEPRIVAAYGNCGPYDWGECFDALPQVTKEAYAHYSGAKSMTEARELADQLSLDGVASKISCPLLIVHGSDDPLIPWEQGKRIADEGGGQFMLIEGGTHGVQNMPHLFQSYALDWMTRYLGGAVS